MGKIYFTSDLHFGHDREFIWRARGYSSVQEMNEKQVEYWNSTATDEDDIYVLGDLMLGDLSNIKYLKQLKGNIHIVFGNHDTAPRQAAYAELPNVVETAWAIMLKYKKHHFYCSHFPTLTGNLEHESLKKTTCNLFGHTHQTTNFHNDIPFMYHVGVDSHNGHLVLLDDIIEEMYAKVKECLDFLGEEPVEQATSSNVYTKKNYKLDIAAPAEWDSLPDPHPAEQVPAAKIFVRCGQCVNNYWNCGNTDEDGKCPAYRRDPPDGGYYG